MALRHARGGVRAETVPALSATCFPGGESPLATRVTENRNTPAFVGDFLLRFIRCAVDVTAVTAVRTHRLTPSGCSDQPSTECQSIRKMKENSKEDPSRSQQFSGRQQMFIFRTHVAVNER